MERFIDLAWVGDYPCEMTFSRNEAPDWPVVDIYAKFNQSARSLCAAECGEGRSGIPLIDCRYDVTTSRRRIVPDDSDNVKDDVARVTWMHNDGCSVARQLRPSFSAAHEPASGIHRSL